MPPDAASHPLPCLMVGFDGQSVPPLVRRRLREGTVSGIVLFSRNVEGPRQVRELCREIRAAAGAGRPQPLIAIDQEGGRVRRLKDPRFTQFPPARCYGWFCRCQGETVAEAAGRTMAAELAAVGIDIDFAPVLDVDSNPRNPVIGDRSLSSDPAAAARLGIAFAAGMLSRGLVPVGKHFPGHGASDADSHRELPVVRASRATLLSRDLLPFRRAIRAGIPALMTAHVVYPALDRFRPATLSRKILTDLLRRRLRFGGVVFSDALEMKAISDRMGIGGAAVEAVRAGCDAVLVCRPDEAMQEEAVEALGRAGRDDAAFRAAAAAASRRVSRLRDLPARREARRATLRQVGSRKHRELAALLHECWSGSAPASAGGRSGNIGEG